MWRRLVLKIVWLFQMIDQRCRTKAILGEKVYDAWFTVPMPQSVSQSSQPVVHRIINGQVVGRQLERGEGAKDRLKATMDPIMCQHPTENMKARGNAKALWWFCEKCASRWHRQAVSEVNQSVEPRTEDLITFGKHAGKKYVEVYMHEPKYCEWVMETVAEGEASPELARLAHFIHAHQMRETYAADEWDDFGGMETDGA